MSTATAEPTTQPKGMVSSIAHAFDAAGEIKVAEPIIQHQNPVPDEPVVEPKTSLLDTIEPEPEPKIDHRKLTAAQWKEVNADRDRLKAELAAAQKKEQEYSTSIKDLDSYKSKAQRVQELEEKLALKDYESTDEYQNTYVQPREQTISQATAFAKELGLPEDLVERMASTTPGGRIKLLDEHVESSAAQAVLGSLLSEYDRLGSKAKAELGKWKEKAATLTAAEKAKALQSEDRQRQEIVTAFDAALPKIAEKLTPFRRKDGDEAHNKMVDENIAHARAIITGEASLEDIAAAPYMAVAARSALTRLAASEKQLKAAMDRLAEYENANPKLGGGSAERDNGTGQPKGMLDRTKSAFAYQ